MKCWIILGIMFALSTAPAHQVGGAAIQTSQPSCILYPPPKNGALACNSFGGTSRYCQVFCNDGYHFERKPPLYYFCENGKWSFIDLNPAADFDVPWPDCFQTTPSPPPATTY